MFTFFCMRTFNVLFKPIIPSIQMFKNEGELNRFKQPDLMIPCVVGFLESNITHIYLNQ